MTIFLSESDVAALLDMDEVIRAVEEAFRQEGMGGAVNHMRTRTRSASSVLNVMHATSPYLSRGGLKAYMSSRSGTKFLVVLFDEADSAPLAVMGADMLGRYRTGAASGVATKHLYRKSTGSVAICGTGRQALTQALALDSVMDVQGFRVWSPNRDHRRAFTKSLEDRGLQATAADSPWEASKGADVVSTVTSSKAPFLDEKMLDSVAHVNLCGGNVPEHAEITAGGVGCFDAIVVDDLAQAKAEYGDLIQAARAGSFSWDSAVELGSVVAGSKEQTGKTLFKSGGAALEDVAVANLVYEKARSHGHYVDFSFF
ncbi:MAG: ornithine cyclodeaminase family protein [Nitrososphaerota archaeon]|nr:ornithine cyclodeaminase family protein [Nitrososphaerota archaeon]